jgi:hypothetical protein
MAIIETIPVKDDYRRKLAYKMLMEGTDASPVQHWAQGLGRMGQAALGGYEMYRADQRDKETEAGNNAALIAALQGGGVPSPTQPTPQRPTAQPMPPVSSVTPSAGAVPAALSGDRAGGPVMPSAKVWGDAEAEAAGLYEKPANPRIAANGPVALPPQPAAAPPAQPAPPVTPSPTEPQMADAKARIAAMLQSDNPQMRKLGQGMAQSMLVSQLQGDKPTDEMREYNLYRQQGGKLPFFDYKAGLKKAGAVNVTTNIEKPELAFDTEAGKLQAKRFDELAADGQTAKQMVSDIQTLTDLGKNIGTGKSAEFKAAIGPYAESLGIKIDKLDDIQAYEAVVNRIAPNLRVKGSGAQSDLELKNFLKSLPSLGNTPEGNNIASSVLTGLQENKIRAAEIGSRAMTKEISRSEAEKQLRELPDPMASYREYMKTNRGAPTAAGTKAAPTVINGYTIKAR